MKIIDYQILSEPNTVELARKVCALMTVGYQPLGGPAVGQENEKSNHARPFIVQAMVRYEAEIADCPFCGGTLCGAKQLEIT